MLHPGAERSLLLWLVLSTKSSCNSPCKQFANSYEHLYNLQNLIVPLRALSQFLWEAL